MAEFRAGDIVRWKDEFCREDERDQLFVVLEPTEGECFIRPVPCDWPIVPTMRTRTDYLARA